MKLQHTRMLIHLDVLHQLVHNSFGLIVSTNHAMRRRRHCRESNDQLSRNLCLIFIYLCKAEPATCIGELKT